MVLCKRNGKYKTLEKWGVKIFILNSKGFLLAWLKSFVIQKLWCHLSRYNLLRITLWKKSWFFTCDKKCLPYITHIYYLQLLSNSSLNVLLDFSCGWNIKFLDWPSTWVNKKISIFIRMIRWTWLCVQNHS